MKSHYYPIQLWHLKYSCALQIRVREETKVLWQEIKPVYLRLESFPCYLIMRTEGDITKEEYRKRRDKLNEEINQLQQKMNMKSAPPEPELPLDINAIRETLSEMMSFKEARAWRKLFGDYVRNRQWNDNEVRTRGFRVFIFA